MASIFTYIPHVARVVDQVCAGLFGYSGDTFTPPGPQAHDAFFVVVILCLACDEARNLGLLRATYVCRSQSQLAKKRCPLDYVPIFIAPCQWISTVSSTALSQLAFRGQRTELLTETVSHANKLIIIDKRSPHTHAHAHAHSRLRTRTHMCVCVSVSGCVCVCVRVKTQRGRHRNVVTLFIPLL